MELNDAETEIDIVAVGEQPKALLIGECKFKGHPFSYADFLDTFAKLTPQKTSSEFYYALFSESGFDEKVIQAAKAEKIFTCFLWTILLNKNVSSTLVGEAFFIAKFLSYYVAFYTRFTAVLHP